MPDLPNLPDGDHQWEQNETVGGVKHNDYRIFKPPADRHHYKVRVVKEYDRDKDTVMKRTTDLNVTWDANGNQSGGNRVVTVWEHSEAPRVKAKLFYTFTPGPGWHITRGDTTDSWYHDGEPFDVTVVPYNDQGQPITSQIHKEQLSHP